MIKHSVCTVPTHILLGLRHCTTYRARSNSSSEQNSFQFNITWDDHLTSEFQCSHDFDLPFADPCTVPGVAVLCATENAQQRDDVFPLPNSATFSWRVVPPPGIYTLYLLAAILMTHTSFLLTFAHVRHAHDSPDTSPPLLLH